MYHLSQYLTGRTPSHREDGRSVVVLVLAAIGASLIHSSDTTLARQMRHADVNSVARNQAKGTRRHQRGREAA